MSDLLDQALIAARDLSPEVRDDLARLVLAIAGCEAPPVALSAAEQASLSHSREQAMRREFASDEQVRAAWAKHGL